MTTDASTATTTDATATTDAANGTVNTPEGGAPKPAAPAAPAAPASGEQAPINTATGKPWTLTEALSAIQDLRNKDAQTRVQRKGLPDALRTLAEAAGLELPDEAPTVESVSRDLQARTVDLDRAKERATKAESDLAILRAAWAAGIDPAREKYLAFALSDDTEVTNARGTDTYGATVAAKITALVASDPMLKGNAGSGSRASGADNFGGAGGGGQMTPEQFEALSYEDRLALFEKNPEEYRRLSAG